MAQDKHVHKYKRVTLKTVPLYKCMLMGCPHYIRAEMVIGRLSLCWGNVIDEHGERGNCGNAVELDEEMINRVKIVKPLCSVCREERRKRLEFMKSIPKEEEKV